MNFRSAFHARNAVALKKELQELRLLNRQIHAVQGVIAGVREHLVALRTLVALAVLAAGVGPAGLVGGLLTELGLSLLLLPAFYAWMAGPNDVLPEEAEEVTE